MNIEERPSARLVTVTGSHRQMGRQLGEECRDGISRSLSLVLTELGAGSDAESVDQLRKYSLNYLSAIATGSPHLVDELEGLAEGAGITFADALILQLRFEIVGFGGRGAMAASGGCSSFAIHRSGKRLAGQNVDVPPEHRELGMLVRMVPLRGPSLLFYTYFPGMIGYVGINSEGLALFANALLAPGWRSGFPRYFLLRRALEQRTVADVVATVRSLRRASTINILVSDSEKSMADIELTVDDMEVLRPENDVLFHSNHYLADRLRDSERLIDVIPDSPARYEAGQVQASAQIEGETLFNTGRRLLQNHENFPASICRHPRIPAQREADNWVTVASLIAEPDDGKLHVCYGNPCECEYACASV